MEKYTEDDMVSVVDAEGNVLENKVPKAWLGTDLLPAGTKKASGKAKKAAESGEADSGGVPAGNASRDDWEKYARSQGAQDADLLNGQGEPLSRDEIRDKYTAQS